MPVDPAWERVHFAHHFEYLQRTRRKYDFAPETAHDGKFDPGELAIAEGGIALAWLSFLEHRKFSLTREELYRLHTLRQRKLHRHCVVLDRIDENSYYVCFLATFDNIGHGSKITSPIVKFFSLAFGDTPPWPPGHDPIKLRDGWKNSFVFCIPVVRSNLRIPNGAHQRAVLEAGEVQRITGFMQKRVKVFDQHHERFRRAELEYHSSSGNELTSVSASSDVAIGPPAEAESVTQLTVEDGEPRTAVPRDPGVRSRFRRRRESIPKFDLHDRFHNGSYLLANMRKDIMNASLYFQTAPRLHSAPTFVKIPRPYYAPSLRATKATLSKILFR